MCKNMQTLHATLIAVNETQYWQAETLAQYQIEAAFCLYVVPDDGESTVDVVAYPLENVFHFEPDTPEHIQDAARDYLEREGLESVAYLSRGALDCDLRFRSREELCNLVPADDVESAWREQAAAGFDTWPDILNPETFAAWQAEKRDARRALNVPPIANYGANGLDNLPLFVAAANNLLQECAPAVERLARIKGECAAMKAQKRRLYDSGLTWALPPAELFKAAQS